MLLVQLGNQGATYSDWTWLVIFFSWNMYHQCHLWILLIHDGQERACNFVL